MPFTTVDQLTPNSSTGSIENGNGSVDSLGALYYFEDIERVITQEGFNRLVQKNVLFERVDGENLDQRTGLPVHEITVLAAEDEFGDLLPIVAAPWPSYYKRPDHNGTVDFPGSDNYFPGQFLTK